MLGTSLLHIWELRALLHCAGGGRGWGVRWCYYSKLAWRPRKTKASSLPKEGLAKGSHWRQGLGYSLGF